MKRLLRSARLLILLLLAGLPYASAQSTSTLHFTSDPSLTPDGQYVVFSYESDLWKVPSEGGEAVRLTGMEGRETHPRISPDGRWIAFTSTQYGNQDVYVMPFDGGSIHRLTYNEAGDRVDSWSWNSKKIYFVSDRYNRMTEYSVTVDGGTPERLFGNYFNTIHNLVEHPKTNEVFFNESWESSIFAHRKHYKGAYNPDIKSYNPKTGKLKKYTDYNGKDFWATIDRDGHIYFVSDQANGEYNLYTFRDGKKTRLTDFDTSVKKPQVSADGSRIVFEKEYQLFVYDVNSGKARKLAIKGFDNRTLDKAQDFNVKGEITAFDISPDNKKFAFVSRGELFVSDTDGKFVRELNTRPEGRVMEVKWLPDNHTLIFNQTVRGYQNWFTIAADGSGSEKQLTDENRNNRLLEISHDSTKALYLSGRDALRLMDLDTFKSRTIVKDEFWAMYNPQPHFAPNDEYITYTAHRNFEEEVFVYNLEKDKSFNLTHTGVTETSPAWSPDGRDLFFVSNRTEPSYPYGLQDSRIYRMPLQNYAAPFKSDKFDELFADKKKEDESDGKKEKIEIQIDSTDIMKRLEQVGPRFGSQQSPTVFQKDGKTIILYASNHDQGDYKLWKTTLDPFGETKTEVIDGAEGGGYQLAASGDERYLLMHGTINKLDLDKGSVKPVRIDYTFRRNLRDEFDQMFDEVWAGLQENYYNGNFNGIDWKAIKERYASYLPYLHSRANLRRMLNDMLGELNSSHIGFYSTGKEEKAFYKTRTLSPGLLFKKDNPYEVASVVTEGPADVAGVDIRPGDRLVSVDGQQVDEARNREAYFVRPSMDDELQLTFKRGGDTYSVKLHPESYTATRSHLYDAWIRHNQQRVDRESDQRIAYVYMKNMGGGQLEQFLIDMVSEAYKKDGLIFDLRYNTGGNVHDRVLEFLSHRPYLKWRYRDGKFTIQPNFAPSAKPIVLLVNEQSLSDAEMTSAGYKALDLGPVIGTETYRWIIFTSGKSLVDGSFYRLPSWGVYTLDGRNLERTGVKPDIYVNNDFTDRLNDRDPQLERAIREVMNKLNQQ